MKVLKKIATLVALSMPVITLASCGFEQEIPEDYQEKTKIDVENISFDDRTIILTDSITENGYDSYQAQYKGTKINETSIPIEGVSEVSYTCKKITTASNGDEIKTTLDTLTPNEVGTYEYTLSLKINTKKYSLDKQLEPRRVKIVYENTTYNKITFSPQTVSYDGTAKNIYATYRENDTTDAVEIKDGYELPQITSYKYLYKGIDGTTYAESENAPTAAGTYEVTLELNVAENYFDDIINPQTTLTISETPANITITGTSEYTELTNGNISFGNGIELLQNANKSNGVDAKGYIKASGGKATPTQNSIKVSVSRACLITAKVTTTKDVDDKINNKSNDISNDATDKLLLKLVALDAATGDTIASSVDYIVNRAVNPTPEIAIYLPSAGEYVIGGETSGIYLYQLTINYDKTESDLANYDLSVDQVKENYAGLIEVVFNTIDEGIQTEPNKAAKNKLIEAIKATTTKEDALAKYKEAIEAIRTYSADSNQTPETPSNVTYKASDETAITTKVTEETTLTNGLVLLKDGRIDGSTQRYNLAGSVKNNQNGLKFTVSAPCVILVKATSTKSSNTTISKDADKIAVMLKIINESGSTITTANDYLGLSDESKEFALYLSAAGTYIIGGDCSGCYITELTIDYTKTSADVAAYDRALSEHKVLLKSLLTIVYNSSSKDETVTSAYNTALANIENAETKDAATQIYKTAVSSVFVTSTSTNN